MADSKSLAVTVSESDVHESSRNQFNFRVKLGQMAWKTRLTVKLSNPLPDGMPKLVMGQVRRYEHSGLDADDNFAVTVTGSTSEFLFFNIIRVDGRGDTGMEYSLDILVIS